MVVEHIHGLVLERSHRHRDTKTTALEIPLALVEKRMLPFVEAAWINELLEMAAAGDMDDETFAFFLRLTARREEEDIAIPPSQGYICAQGRPAPPEAATSEYTLFTKVS